MANGFRFAGVHCEGGVNRQCGTRCNETNASGASAKFVRLRRSVLRALNERTTEDWTFLEVQRQGGPWVSVFHPIPLISP